MLRLSYGGACVLVPVVLLSKFGECITYLSSFSSDYSDCEDDTSLIADGVCDAAVNTAACGFDGGDCCECTCFIGGVLCDVTEAQFSCEDPDAPTDCGPSASSSPSPGSSLEQSECAGYVPHIQDGYCDETNNNAACGFDGGDCCACTCGDGLAHPCGVEGEGFDCQDPDVPANCSLSIAGCGGSDFNIQDSFCDSSLNNAECGYDGGDCCRCTCRDFGHSEICGLYGYDCIDPDASVDCETGSPTPSPTVAGYPDCEGSGFYLGDGQCDSSNNNLECGWDGGDCCRCTCAALYYFSCSSFDCLDPSAPTECASESPAPSSHTSGYYSVGESPTTSTSDFYLDTDDTGITTVGDDDECQEPVWLISDGRCDVKTNTAVCGWDGGDCCECTCVDESFSCGGAGYNCLDPAGAGDDCSRPSPSPASGEDEASLQDTPTPATSLTSAEVGGVVSIAVFGFVSVAGLIVGSLVCIRRKCQTSVE